MTAGIRGIDGPKAAARPLIKASAARGRALSRYLLVLLLLVALPVAIFPASPSVAAEVSPVETSIRDVQRGSGSSTGATALLGFTAAQDIVGDVSPGERLGGARIDRAAHPDAFEGAWAQGGQVGGWLAPFTEDANRHYQPTATLIENAYFDNSLDDDASAAVPGDHAEFGMGIVPMDTPLPWDRARGDAGGTLGWDGTVVTQEVHSSFGGNEADLDVVMFRADVVARSGDVDARERPIQMEPLVLDLPRSYEGVPNFVGITGLSTPYLHYITDFSAVPLWSAGKLVIRAEVSGYIPEARVYTLANGAVMKEWHIPLAGVISFDRSNSDLTPVASATLPQGGLAMISDALGDRSVELPPGAALQAQPGSSQDGGETTEEDEERPEGVVDPSSGSELDPHRAELLTAGTIDHGLDETVDLDLETSGFRAQLDPDFAGEGVLALRNVETTLLKKTYADAVTVPAAVVDGSTIRLDRHNLIDLRVLPYRDGGGIGFTFTARFEEFNQSTTQVSRVYRSGLLVHAVHDVGNGLHAFVEHQLFHGGVPPGGRVNSKVVFQPLDARTINAYPIQYVELAQPGPATFAGNLHESEFSATTFGTLEVGDHRTRSAYRTTNRIFGGKLTVLRAPAPLLGRAPDGGISISGQKLVLLHEPPDGLTASPTTLTSFGVGLANGPSRGPVISPPLGEACTDVVIAETVPDAPPVADIREAWFDADLRNVYASLRLAQVPSTPLSPTGDRYSVNWRTDHEGYSARATLSASGWSFELGWLIFGSYLRAGTITGEVQPGADGVIRMAIPRDWLDLEDGVMLRDTGAHASVGTTNIRADHAPEGSSFAYGIGGDHLIETCPASIPPVLDTVLDFTSETTQSVAYGGEATFAVKLVDENDEPVRAADVSFALTSDDGAREWLATTDDSGVARVITEITERSGTYDLVARYAGLDGSYASAEKITTLEVLNAPTVIELMVEGTGSQRVLSADLARSDSAQPIAGRTVEFYAGSELIGSAVTDESGTAALQAPPGSRGGPRDFEARFPGDDYFLGSSDDAQPDAPGKPR